MPHCAGCGEMADLDTAAADEREMLRPALGIGSLDQPRHAIEALGRDSDCRGETERDPVQNHAHLRGQGPQRAQISARGPEIIVRDDLDHIDPVEMGENPGGELGAPAEPEPIAPLSRRCPRNRHSHLRRPRSPIRMKFRNPRPNSRISYRHAADRRTRGLAAQIVRTLPRAALCRSSLRLTECSQRAGAVL
jgi:hypothetical protein